MAQMDRGPRVRCTPDSVLLAACRTLLATSPEVVRAFSLSVAAGEYEGNVSDWCAVAHSLAEQYELRVEVSMPRDQLHVRFSRYMDGERE
jgi:hypothetical protein